jgi:2,3-bisphosphoglycerate-dependent phosphoglycerate mutase
MMTHDIIMLRHGETLGNLERRIQGQIDFPLSETGRRQVDTLANLWHKEGMQFDLIITSTLKRATETAQIIAQVLQIPIEENPIWMERSFGSLEGVFLEDAMIQDPGLDFFQPYSRIGEAGESQVELYSRALIAVQDLINRPPGSYLVVSHGSIMNKALYVIFGITPQGNYNSPIIPFGNTAYLRLGYRSETRQWLLYEYSNPMYAKKRGK